MDDEGSAAGGVPGQGEPWLLVRQRELRSSAGYRALALVDRVKRISYVFHGNVAQYRGLAARLQDPGFSLPIMDVRNPGAHDDLLSEAERLLLNVLTAMTTRVDQQRVFMDKYFADDAEFASAYKDEVAVTFQGDVAATFLKRLRNHLAHHLLPVSQTRSTMSNTGFEITLVLPVAPLLEWDWNQDVRAWITSSGDSVDIVRVIDNYALKTTSFDRWLMGQLTAKYATEISSYQQSAAEYMQQYNQAFGYT